MNNLFIDVNEKPFSSKETRLCVCFIEGRWSSYSKTQPFHFSNNFMWSNFRNSNFSYS